MLAAALLMAFAPLAEAHAYLKFPPLRGGAQGSSSNAYCPQCGNGAGVCGDGGQWGSSSNFLDSLAGPRTSFSPGEEVEFSVQVTAHHMGYFEFSICDRHLDSSVADAQSCLDSHRLVRVGPAADCVANDARGDCQPLHAAYPERWYLPPGTGVHSMRYRIPDDLLCSSCTLQWRWWTANSCQPATDAGCYFDMMRSLGWDADAWCGAFCGSCPPSLLQSNASRASAAGCGEEFRNCADIAVGQGGSSPSPPSPSPPVPTADPEPEAEPEAEAESTLSPTSAPGPSPAGCGSCTACMWSSGQCYSDASQSYCESWAENTWCGPSLAQVASARHAIRRHSAPAFLGPSLIQDGTAVSRAALSSQKDEEL